MALFNQFCNCMLFLLVVVVHVRAQQEFCSVDNDKPKIEENNRLGLAVANITTATGVTVVLDSSSVNYAWFEINGSQLILNHSVDYEDTPVLVVGLQCMNEGTMVHYIIVAVTVENLNDNPPVFKQTNITVNVNEDTKVNAIIVPQANVTATDADLDVVLYSLTGRPPEAMEYFSIQGVNNPEIYLLKALDYEKINLMELTLYAMDGNASALGTHTATAAITIHIMQVDLRPPWFQPCTFIPSGILCINSGYTGRVNKSENVTGPLILEPGPLYAVDGDKGLNEKIVYDIVGGNDDDTFSINQDTGNITMNKPVHMLKTFLLQVLATQANNPFRYSQTTVEIKVVQRNDHKPYFEKTNYTGTVSVDLPVSSLIMEAGASSRPLKIFAADDDFLDKVNPNIEYQIQNNTDFTVTKDGFLLTNVVLKVASTITFLAIAYDTEALQEASTLITVEVTPLATTTVLPTTSTTTTTTAAPAIPGTGTTTSKPSGSSSHLPPEINNTLPTPPPGSTNSTTPSASITTNNAGIPGVTGTTTTITTTTTTAAPAITGTGTGTTTSKPSGSSSHLTPEINNTLPTPPSGSTGSATPPASTVTNAGITGITGKPVTSTVPGSIISPATTAKPPIITVNSSQPQTTNFPITGISQATVGTTQSTARTSPQSEATKPSNTGITMATGGTIQSTYLTSSQIGTRQTTASTPSQSGTTRPSITNIIITTGGTVLMSSSPTKLSTASATQSARPITNPTEAGRTSATTLASSEVSRPSTEPHTTSQPGGCTCTEKDLIILGATLGSLLAISLVLLGLISCMYYKQQMRYKQAEDCGKTTEGFTNENFYSDEKPNSDEKDNKSLGSVASENNDPVALAWSGTPPPLKKTMEGSQGSAASEALEEGEENGKDTDSEKEVRSILTKDRKVADDGYKAVWFKEDIDPEAKDYVVVIDEDSSAERNRNESDDDRDGDDDNIDSSGGSDDNDSGKGGSDVSYIPGRAWPPRTDPIAGQFDENTEERDIFL